MSMNGHAQMGQIESVLTRAAAGFERRHGEGPRGACLYEKIDNRTPYHEAVDAEERTLSQNGQGPGMFDDLDEQEEGMRIEGEEAMRIALEAHFWLLDFLFADGPHPGKVMRRLYAWVKKYRPEAVWDMGYRDMGKLFDESGAAIEWRVSVLLDDYAKAKGLRGVKMPWQRSEEANRNYSAVQAGNANRVGGKRAGKYKAAHTTAAKSKPKKK